MNWIKNIFKEKNKRKFIIKFYATGFMSNEYLAAEFVETISDFDMSPKRGIDRKLIFSLAQGFWINEHLNVIITGATGVGKTYLGCALGRSACEQGASVRYFKTSRLLHEIECCHADGSWGKFLDKLAKIQLIILDDWFRDTLNLKQTRNLLEVFDDRWQKGSVIIISQLDSEDWHSRMHR